MSAFSRQGADHTVEQSRSPVVRTPSENPIQHSSLRTSHKTGDLEDTRVLFPLTQLNDFPITRSEQSDVGQASQSVDDVCDTLSFFGAFSNFLSQQSP